MTRTDAGQLVLVAAMWGTSYLFIRIAAPAIPAGLSSVLSSTTPLFAALIGAIWLGERLTLQRMAGVAIGFAGVLLLVADNVHPGHGARYQRHARCAPRLPMFCFSASSPASAPAGR